MHNFFWLQGFITIWNKNQILKYKIPQQLFLYNPLCNLLFTHTKIKIKREMAIWK